MGSTPGGMNRKGFSEGGGVRVLEAGIEEWRRERKEGVVVRLGMGREKVWVRGEGGVWKRKVSVIDALLSAIVMVG